MDSYDKLKPYGICVNGCVDGFSRHVIWLRVGSTSSDPKVVAGYYLDAVKTLGGCPQTLRSDLGTENNTVEQIQTTLGELFQENGNSRPTFIYGRSPANQRIESWWSILRKQNVQYWMNLFQALKEDGHFNGTFLDKSLIQFCFVDIIQNELNEVVLEWNVHKIRNSRNSISPSGRPIIMYEMPALYNTQNYLREVPSIMFDLLQEECTFHIYPCDKDVFDLCNILMLENGYTSDQDPYNAVQLYIRLRREINNLL